MDAAGRSSSQSPVAPPRLALAVGPLLITLLVAALAGLAIWTEYLRYRERATVATQNMTRLVEAHLADTFDKVDVFLQLVAAEYVEHRDGAVQPAALAERLLSLQRIPLVGLDGVRIADAQGRVVLRKGRAQGVAEPVGEEAFFVRARDQPSELVISGPHLARDGGPPLLVFARAAHDAAGGFVGVAYANLRVTEFDTILGRLELGPNGAATLRTDDLLLVHRHPVSAESREAVGTARVSPDLRAAVARSPAQGEYLATTPLDQHERNNVYRKVRNYPFYVIVGQSTRDYLEGWRTNALLFAALAGVTVALTLFAWWTQSRWSRRQLVALHNRFEALVQTSQDAIIGKSVQGIVTSWNRGAQQMFGYGAAEMVGKSMAPLIPPDRPDEEPALLARVRHGERIDAFETVRMRKDGSLLDVSVALSPILGSDGAVVGVSSIARDVSRHKAMEAEIRAMAFNDPLTKLPNRRLLMDRLRQAQLASARQHTYFAVLFIDLDKFKQVNDQFGHDVGDHLLVEVARRLQAAVRQHDTVARLGGDEFVVLLEELGAEEKTAANHVNTVADKIMDAIEREYTLRGRKHRCSASVGIRLLVGSQDSTEQVLMEADAAMYRVKHQRRTLAPFGFG